MNNFMNYLMNTFMDYLIMPLKEQIYELLNDGLVIHSAPRTL